MMEIMAAFPISVSMRRVDNASELVPRVVAGRNSMNFDRFQQSGRVLIHPLAAYAEVKKTTQAFVLPARSILTVGTIPAPVGTKP